MSEHSSDLIFGVPGTPPEEGASTSEELEYRLRQQQLLAEFGFFAARQRSDKQALLQEATRVCADGLQTSLCKVLQSGETETDRLLVRAGVGWAADVVGQATIGGDIESPAGYALQTGRPVISNHLGGESRFRTPALLAEHGVRRAINVLIPDGNSPFGVLEADSPNEGRFTRYDIAFMQGIASLLGVAIERHEAEARRRESERRFRATFEQAAVGMGHVGVDGTWLDVNQKLCVITGYAREELLALKFQDITHSADLEADLRQVEALLAGRIGTYGMEKRYIRKDGSSTWVNLTVSLVRDDSENPLYFISVIEDINERKQAEAVVRELTARLEERVATRTTDLESANKALVAETAERERAQAMLRHSQKMKAIGELTSGIAHDFNNVLMAIGGSLELARRLEGGKARRRLELASSAVERGARLARDLLSFSRTSPEQQGLVALRERIEAVRELLDRTLGRSVQITAELPEGLWAVEIDPDQLDLAIMNAAVNARDAMNRAGEFRISARNVSFDPGADPLLHGHFVELALSDRGPGMAAEVAERAFEPFFTTKRKAEGTGLGLAQIYAFASQSGGTARIESSPGEGTTIRVFLRAALS